MGSEEVGRFPGPAQKFWVGWSEVGPRNLYSERAPPRTTLGNPDAGDTFREALLQRSGPCRASPT